jgi:hypothetical protein
LAGQILGETSEEDKRKNANNEISIHNGLDGRANITIKIRGRDAFFEGEGVD